MSSLLHTFRYSLVVACLFTASPGNAQQSTADTLLKKFDDYRMRSFQEKIYVHTDRQAYLSGETLWFKLYLTDATLHKPATLSKVAYVEILDRSDRPVLQTKIAMSEGSGFGSLYLPPSLDTDHYTVRAYTSWMKNFSPDLYFNKSIAVVNTFKKTESSSAQASVKTAIQFFPEGGNLIAGLKNKIAFQATDASGKGISFHGALINHQNDTVAVFDPLKFGIGNFTFTPKADEVYKAVLRDASGRVSTHTFPVASSTGYQLSLADTTDQSLFVSISRSPTTAVSEEAVYLFVHTRNVVSKVSYQLLHQGTTTVKIDKNSIGEGISHITIFNDQLKPLAERLYFKQPEKKLSVSISADEARYLNRRRVRLELQTSGPVQQLSSSNVSVSVFQQDSITTPGLSIGDYFWLTSELKGSIESPSYYLDGPSTPEKNKAIDNLMLTHGWRRFRWEDVFNAPAPIKFIPEYRGHIIRGIVKNDAGEPAPGIITYLASPGSTIRLFPARSNDTGEVSYEMQRFTGPARIVVQTNYKKDSLVKVEILSPFSDQFSDQKLPSIKIEESYADQLLQRSVAMQVQDIYYEERLEVQSHVSLDSTTFYGKADETYYLDAFTRFPVMEEVMREYVVGVWVRKHKDGFHFMIPDRVHKQVFTATPLMLIDGVPFFDEDEIMNFDPLRIRRLDVMARMYYLGPVSFPGVVSYRTYKNDLGGFELNPRAVSLDYDGLQRQREFYSPRYENPKQRQSRLPDQRTLLYWDPQVITGPDGKKQLEFYTSDLSGQFNVVVEGMTQDGQLCSGHATIIVVPPAND